jgi:hypothetical protein
MPGSDDTALVLTRVQVRRALAYLRVLNCAVIDGDVEPDALPMWTQLEEVIVGLEGLSLTVDALREALGEDDDEDGGGEEDGVREPRDPPPRGGLAFEERDASADGIEAPSAQSPRVPPPISSGIGDQ